MSRCRVAFDWIVQAIVAGAVLACGAAAGVRADEESPGPRPSAEQMNQAREAVETAKGMGWDRQYLVMEEATDLVFAQNGWTSEPDQYTRQLMREIGQIPPWNQHQRQEVFLNGLQSRLDLTQDQRSYLNSEMKREAMTVTLKHFKEMAPIVLELAKTRASDQPFTPEQVQRWSQNLKPIMDDALQSVQRVSKSLEKTMSEDQRRKLDADMQALVRRHQSIEKMVEKWKRGQWSPADWGLQNDPVHAGIMAELAARDAAVNAQTDALRQGGAPDEKRIATNASEWDQYVKWFCKNYQCDSSQRTKAEAILKSSKKEAMGYRSSKQDLIEQYEARIASAEEPAERKKTYAADLEKMLSPVAEVFTRMKNRLYEDVLTTEQRIKYTPSKKLATGS